MHDTTLGLHLFRIMSFRHVIDMFEAKSLHMSMPWSWDDPYEKLVDYSRQERVFAQCWSKRETSDAMWRIYSPDRMGLCVRTTRARLTQVLQSARATTPFDFRIDDVEYLPDAAAVERASTLVHDAEAARETAKGVIASLFIKCAAFDHEAEVRAVLHLLGESEYVRPGPTLRLPIDPHQLVDRIEFDPRVELIFERMCTHYLRTVANFEGEIRRSTLYAESEWLIVV